jgi:hypothetical protein
VLTPFLQFTAFSAFFLHPVEQHAGVFYTV